MTGVALILSRLRFSRYLWSQQVLQSDIKAKMESPDLFILSPANNVKGNVFRAEADRSAAHTYT